MTETPLGGEASSSGASGGILGTNNLQRAIDSFDRSVNSLRDIAQKWSQASQSYQQGRKAGGSWNAMSNWMGGGGGVNGGGGTFGGQPASSGGNQQQRQATTGNGGYTPSHAADTPTVVGGGPLFGGGGAHSAGPSVSGMVGVAAQGAGMAVGAAGMVSSAYQSMTQGKDDSNTDSNLYLSVAQQYAFNGGSGNARRMFNYANYANNGADAAQANMTLMGMAGGTATGPQMQALQGGLRQMGYANPFMSAAQNANTQSNFYSNTGYAKLATVGVRTIGKGGQRQSPLQIANQVLAQVDPQSLIRSEQDADALVGDPFSSLNVTLGNWLANGLVDGDQVQAIKDNVRNILKARAAHVGVGKLQTLMNTSNMKSSRAALSNMGIGSTRLQGERDLGASQRQGSVNRLDDFNDAAKRATEGLGDFTDAINKATGGPVGSLIGRWRGLTQHGIRGAIAGTLGQEGLGGFGSSMLGGFGGLGEIGSLIGGLGGDNESRMSVLATHGGGGSVGGGGAFGSPYKVGQSGGNMGGAGGSGGRGGGGGGQRMILPARGPLGTPFGQAGPMWSSGHHTGQDILVPSGTPIHAPANGRVIFSGWDGPYGNLVKIDHGGGIVSYMAHNSRLVAHVGASVRQGQLIAYSGATGNVTGPHCHFEVRVNGVPVNPMKFVTGGGTVSGNAGGGAGSTGSTGSAGSSGSGTSGGSMQSSDISNLLGGGGGGGAMGVSGVGGSELAALMSGGTSGGGGGGIMDLSSLMGSMGTGSGMGSPGGGGGSGITNNPGSGSAPKTSGPTTGNLSGNKAIVNGVAAMYGWGKGPEWDALVALVNSESGFNNHAQNPTSTAYGMFQFLDSTWHGYPYPKTSDAYRQAVDGLRYVKNRYGTPEKAWSFHKAHNWYDKGAWDIPNDQVAEVHKREMIIPAKEADQIREILVNGNPYGAQGNQSHSGSGMSLQFGANSIHIHVSSTGDAQGDGKAIGKAFLDTLSQNQRITNLQRGKVSA